MNKEKLIKNQALTSLKGSWIILIAMVLTISAVMIAIYSMGSIVQLITKSLDTATGMANREKNLLYSYKHNRFGCNVLFNTSYKRIF